MSRFACDDAIAASSSASGWVADLGRRLVRRALLHLDLGLGDGRGGHGGAGPLEQNGALHPLALGIGSGEWGSGQRRGVAGSPLLPFFFEIFLGTFFFFLPTTIRPFQRHFSHNLRHETGAWPSCLVADCSRVSWAESDYTGPSGRLWAETRCISLPFSSSPCNATTRAGNWNR